MGDPTETAQSPRNRNNPVQPMAQTIALIAHDGKKVSVSILSEAFCDYVKFFDAVPVLWYHNKNCGEAVRLRTAVITV